jgi:serine/threonine protein phosphatase PrpC
VGAVSELKVDTLNGTLKPADTFLLASDGLTRLVSEDEILAAFSLPSIEDAADQLLALALNRGAPDNVTLVIVSVT